MRLNARADRHERSPVACPARLPGVDLEDLGTGDNTLAQFGGGEPSRVGHIPIECRLIRELDHLYFERPVTRVLPAHARRHDGAVLGKESEHGVFVDRQPFVLAGVAPQEHAKGERITGHGCTVQRVSVAHSGQRPGREVVGGGVRFGLPRPHPAR